MCNTENHDFYNWLAGFIDGEGHFGIYPQYGKGKRHHPRAMFQFRLKLREDDFDVLRLIMERVGFGKLYHLRVTKSKRENSKPQYSFQTGTVSEAIKLINIIDSHGMRSKKRRDYDIWRRAVLLSVEIGNTKYENFEDISMELTNVRKYSQPIGTVVPSTLDT